MPMEMIYNEFIGILALIHGYRILVERSFAVFDTNDRNMQLVCPFASVGLHESAIHRDESPTMDIYYNIFNVLAVSRRLWVVFFALKLLVIEDQYLEFAVARVREDIYIRGAIECWVWQINVKRFFDEWIDGLWEMLDESLFRQFQQISNVRIGRPP